MEKIKTYFGRIIAIIGIVIIVIQLFIQLDFFFVKEDIDTITQPAKTIEYKDSVDKRDLWKNTEFME